MMRLLILAVTVTAALAVPCPPQCRCGTGDELERTCTVGGAKVTFNGRNNEYVNIKCFGTSFTCEDLPVLNFGNNQTLPSLGVSGCSPAILRCVNRMLQASSVTTVFLTNESEALLDEDVQGLGDVKTLIIKNGSEKTVPMAVIKRLPSLREVHISMSNISLQSEAFLGAPPLRVLELSADKIKEIPDNAFVGLSKLEEFRFWGNNFSHLGPVALKGLDSLETLSLNTNHLTAIAPGAFAHVPNLKDLSLFGNQLDELPAGVLHNLPQLENITLMYNAIELKLRPKALSNLPSLRNLKLESSLITTLPEDLLTGNEELKMLSLVQNRITTLPDNFFKDLMGLEVLDLSHNKIVSLNTGVFSSLRKLKHLNLDMNILEHLPDYLFSGLRKLNYVSIDYNRLTTIGESAFQGAIGLQTLSLRGNKLTLKPPNALSYQFFEEYSPFNMLVELKKLVLSGNFIDTMFSDWRYVLTHLEELDLSYNDFSFLQPTDLQFLSGTIVVNLQNNNISSVVLSHATQSPFDQKSPSDQKSPNSSILLNYNPLDCDCYLYNLAMRLRGAKPETAEPKFIVDNARCASPPHLQGNLFKNVSPNDLNCDLEPEFCDKSCVSCQMRPAMSDLDLHCITIPPTFTDPKTFGLNYTSLKLEKPPTSIQNLSLQLLNLTNAGLQEVLFSPSDTVKVIDFSHNNLTKIPMEFLESNTVLYLSNNPFECQCWFSEEISALQKSDSVADLGSVTCGNGDKLIQVDVFALCSTWRAAAAASATFIVLVLIVFFTAITIYRYSHEILIYITSNGLFPCCFKEDPDEASKEYDVFVSYAHKDRKFFLELLLKLENEFGQKTCVHYRDWSIGDLIPDQINKSVENSRRTVILLSKNFLDSSYANMEFRTAHNLALKEGKTRVILILLEEEVTKHEKLSEELKAYFKTNTYLKWDDPQFWYRLERALPMRNNKKFVWPDLLNQAGDKTVKRGLDVHLNSDGQLVNVAMKEAV